jgi:hypothetical protein
MSIREFFSNITARFMTVWICILFMALAVPFLLIAILNNAGIAGPIVMGLVMVGLTGIPAWKITLFTLRHKDKD